MRTLRDFELEVPRIQSMVAWPWIIDALLEWKWNNRLSRSCTFSNTYTKIRSAMITDFPYARPLLPWFRSELRNGMSWRFPRPERAIHDAQRTTHPGANDRRFTSTENVKYFTGTHPQVASCPNIPEQNRLRAPPSNIASILSTVNMVIWVNEDNHRNSGPAVSQSEVKGG